MYGIQTIASPCSSTSAFENDVKMYGIQTKNRVRGIITNGLSYASEYMKGSPLCYQITMSTEECERSELAMDAIRRL